GSRSTQFARVDAADTSLSIARWCSSAQAIARQNASGSPYNWQARATVALAQIERGDHAEALDAFRGIKAEESSPVGPLAVRAVVLDAKRLERRSERRRAHFVSSTAVARRTGTDRTAPQRSNSVRSTSQR